MFLPFRYMLHIVISGGYFSTLATPKVKCFLSVLCLFCSCIENIYCYFYNIYKLLVRIESNEAECKTYPYNHIITKLHFKSKLIYSKIFLHSHIDNL